MTQYVLYCCLHDSHFYYTSLSAKEVDNIVQANGSLVARDPALKIISWILV